VVLTISALATLLFYWGVLQVVMRGFAWCCGGRWGGGALALGAACTCSSACGGAAAGAAVAGAHAARRVVRADDLRHGGVAGTVMVIYGTILAPVVPDALGNVLSAASSARRRRSGWPR